MATDRASRLGEHAPARHEQALQRAQDALAALARNGEPVTIARLASEAGVSRAWIYTQPGLRDQVKRMQHGQPPSTLPARQASSRASDESLRRRLELAHQKSTQLRAENQQLRRDLFYQMRIRAAGSSHSSSAGPTSNAV